MTEMRNRSARFWARITGKPKHLLIAPVIMLLCGPAVSQTTTGSIFGTVSDSTGGVIPKAVVTATNVQTGIVQTVESGASGNYLFPALVPGDYTISAKAPTFSVEVQTGIHLDVNQNAPENFVLKPGSESQTVEVSAMAALVDTRESQLGETIDQARIEDLPLNGRGAYSLVQLVPGVTNFSAQSVIGDQNGTKFSVNGNRTNEDSYYLDGAFNTSTFNQGGNLIPNPDALQEFRLLTNNFDAEYGRFPGGVVNVVTRAGNNELHGTLYDFYRNSALNSKNYFNTTITPLKQNQFGGTVGGPIIHNKAFFFFSYEGLRVRTPTIIASTAIVTPTAAEARGDFSAPGEKLPLMPNGQPYQCNGVVGTICSAQLDPVALNLLKSVPLSDPATHHPAQQSASANTDANQYLARIDYQLAQSHQMFGTFFLSRGTGRNPGQGANQILNYSTGVNHDTQNNVVIGDTWTVSSNKLNTFRPFYTLSHTNITQGIDGNTWAQLGSQTGLGAGPATAPIIVISNNFQMGLSPPGADNIYQQVFGVEDTFNWNAGNHGIKFGGSFFYNHYRETGSYLGTGQANFTGDITGNALADFLLGKARTFRQNNGIDHRLHNPAPSLFFQDDWRVTRKLTLDLGVRWEEFAPFVGQNNFGTFAPNVQSRVFPTAPLGLLTAGDPGVPDGIIHTQWKNFAPRVGFAYDVFGTGTTAIRGAFGLFYATRAVGQVTNTEQQPFILDYTVTNTPNLIQPYANSGLATAPFPYLSTREHPIFYPGATFSGLPANAGFPYVQEYNLNVEQQLTRQMGLRIAYVGSLSRKFYISRDINEPRYLSTPPSNTADLNSRRPYQPTPSTYIFGQIVDNEPAGNASYNALQTTLTRRLSHGFSLLASYTWEKVMDISSNDPANITLTLSDQNNPRRDRARADYNIPQNFVASYIWIAPGLKRWGPVGTYIVGGWQFNGITTLHTGNPINVVSGRDSNNDTISTDRPNVIGNPNLGGGRSRQQKIQAFFNTAAFAQVPAGTPFGNVPRNYLTGPGTVNTDFSAFKNIPIWRESTLQFRAEGFNVFNNVNLSRPNATLTSSSFGKISGSANARVIQFALKYKF